jgi:hypothetical protein
MTNLRIFAAAALLSTAVVVSPSMAQEGGMKGGGQAGAAMSAGHPAPSGGAAANIGVGGRMGGAANVGGGARLSGGAAPMAGGRTALGGNAMAPNAGGNFRTTQSVQSGGPVAQQRLASGSWNGQRQNWNNQGSWNNYNGDWNRGDGDWNRHRGFRGGPSVSFGFGVSPDYYGYDSYAYNDYPAYDDSYAYYGNDDGYVSANAGADPAYCAQRYRSYDPASGTFLGYDGQRHPCP